MPSEEADVAVDRFCPPFSFRVTRVANVFSRQHSFRQGWKALSKVTACSAQLSEVMEALEPQNKASGKCVDSLLGAQLMVLL